MATQATTPRIQLVVLATGSPFHSATKQPSGSRSRKRSQSASVWFQPACSLSRMPKGISAAVIRRIWITAGLSWIQVRAGVASFAHAHSNGRGTKLTNLFVFQAASSMIAALPDRIRSQDELDELLTR